MRISVVLVVVAVTACADKAVVAPAAQQTTPAGRAAPPDRPSAEQLRAATRNKITQYAFEAFPQWAVTHPDKACPDRLAELNEDMSSNDTIDAWGQPLKMMCGASMPPGAKGIAVMSMGEDGKEGTEDDITSWK
jgi:hypothetical protein